MYLALGNFGGKTLGDLVEDGKLVSFNAARYKSSTGLSHPRLYLLSKPVSECSWAEDSSDEGPREPENDGTAESQPKTSRISQESNAKNTSTSLPHSLVLLRREHNSSRT